MNSQSTLYKIVEKLPIYLQSRFKREARILNDRNGNPEFVDVVNFMKEAALKANHPVYGTLVCTIHETTSTSHSHLMTTAATSSEVLNNSRPKRSCIICREDSLDLFKCTCFKSMTVEERCDLAKQHRLCYNCLKPGHSSLKCKLERRCCIQGYGKKHTKFLHRVSTYNAGGQQAHTGESTASSAIAETRVFTVVFDLHYPLCLLWCTTLLISCQCIRLHYWIQGQQIHSALII